MNKSKKKANKTDKNFVVGDCHGFANDDAKILQKGLKLLRYNFNCIVFIKLVND